jgi:cell division septation protein DedD
MISPRRGGDLLGVTGSMGKHRGHGNFPALFFTFSLVILVLALGFVVGRVVVGQAYLDTAPSFENKAVQRSPAVEQAGPEVEPTPGRVYLPPPVPKRPVTEEGGETSLAPGEDLMPGEQESPAAVSAPERPQPAELPKAEDQPEPAGKWYAIQVGLFMSQEGAQAMADELTRAGYPARTEREGREPETRYRVLTGRYRTEATARQALEQIRQEGFPAFLVER